MVRHPLKGWICFKFVVNLLSTGSKMLRNPAFLWLLSAFMFKKFGVVARHIKKISKKPVFFQHIKIKLGIFDLGLSA